MIQDATGLNSTPLELFVVIVLYKMKPSESPSLRTLQAAIACLPHEEAKIRILLYDNTPGGQRVDIPEGMEYVADPENGGLAKAYNYALEIAAKNGFDWLLTLDQDTHLPSDFICKLYHTARFVSDLKNVAAIVPCIYNKGKAISPCLHRKYWPRTSHIHNGFIGILPEKTLAVNSASMFRVKDLKMIGGYDLRFPIWHSDIVVYHRLSSAGLYAFAAGNIQVEHDLSVFDLKNKSTPARYEDILYAEGAFCDEYLGVSGSLVLLIKIFWRLGYRLWTTGATAIYFEIMLKFLFNRLFYPRRYRIKIWNRLAGRIG